MSSSRCAVALALLSTTLAAQAVKLGEPPPPLSIAKWLHGTPVEQLPPGKTTVVVFWSTDCSGCAAHMAEFPKLVQRFGADGVSLVAVTTGTRTNTLATAEARVKDLGKGWNFAVAWDDGTKTADAWTRGLEIRHPGIVIDGAGKVAFVGNPTLLAVPLLGLRAGKWDARKAEAWFATATELKSNFRTTTREQAPAKLAELDALVAESPGFTQILADARFGLLLHAGKTEAAYALGRTLVDGASTDGDHSLLNEIAWSIVDPAAPVGSRDLELALRAAAKAAELTRNRDGNVLDTLARVYAWKHDLKKALELQRRAVLFEPRDEIKKSLQEYEAALQQQEASKEPPKDPGKEAGKAP